jgi:hypothetical protein
MMTQTISTPTVRTTPSASAGRKDTALLLMWQTQHLTGFAAFLSHFLIYFITVLVLMVPTQKAEVEPSAEMTL